jgi:hypothetical protein
MRHTHRITHSPRSLPCVYIHSLTDSARRSQVIEVRFTLPLSVSSDLGQLKSVVPSKRVAGTLATRPPVIDEIHDTTPNGWMSRHALRLEYVAG